MPVIKHIEQRVAIFIDTQNLYHSAKNLYGRKVNFGNVLKKTLADRKLIRAIAYVITSEGGDEKNFFNVMAKDLKIIGWKKASRAANLHLTSRLHAGSLIPSSISRGKNPWKLVKHLVF